MELLEFQESSVWKSKFYKLRETLEKIEGTTKDSALSLKMKSSKVWNSLSNNFKSMKSLGITYSICLDRLILVSSCFQL